jgi:neurotransmitter:Na+ symporter, NSS family
METKEQWSSKIGFILASAGSAIGLGAIWKLPYVTGVSGGGAFILLFLLFSLLIGFPLLLGEFVIGRSTQKEAISAYKQIAPGTKWHWIGSLGVVTCFILLSFYSVIGGWIIQYLFYSLTGQIGEFAAQNYETFFSNSVSNSLFAVTAQAIFLLITIVIVARGVQQGIEQASKFMMPALFILFIILIVRSLTLEHAIEGVRFFLKPDFSSISSQSVLYALGQSFFSLSVGVSVMVTYSSYLSKNENLVQPAISVVTMNLFISILSGLAIFPAVFSLGFEPTAGPGLLFIVLPSVFDQIVFGNVFLILFLALFLFATLTSAFSMLEIVVAAFSKGKGVRSRLSWIVGFAVFIVGIPSALSFSVLSDFFIFNKTIFDALDFLVSNILMPIGALLISIFVSFKMKKDILRNELIQNSRGYHLLFQVWYLLMRYVVPIVIIVVFLDSLQII